MEGRKEVRKKESEKRRNDVGLNDLCCRHDRVAGGGGGGGKSGGGGVGGRGRG